VEIERLSGLICAACSRPLPLAVVDFRTPFACPSCGTVVRVPLRYGKWLALVTILVTTGSAYVLGIEGLKLIVAVVIGFFPVTMLVGSVARRVVPPKLEICRDEDASDDS
jgi:hypothetical protein